MPILTIRPMLGAGALVLLLAACQGVPADFKPDPKLKTASLGELKNRVASACVISQRAKSSAATPLLQRNCGCYAGRVFTAMDKTEVDFYRQSGYFSDSARPKGETALRACNLLT